MNSPNSPRISTPADDDDVARSGAARALPAYVRPVGLGEAVALLERHEAAMALSGGMSLVPLLRHGFVAPSHLIDTTRLAALRGIEVERNVLRIGGGMTHAAVERSNAVRETIPALAALAGRIGDPAVRHRGTLGGSLAWNDPAADYPAAALALAATVVTTHRRIAADEFFTGLFETALQRGELIVAVEFPVPLEAAWAKFRHPASGSAVVGVFVARRSTGVSVAVTGTGTGVLRWTAAEAALRDTGNASAISGLRFPADKTVGDIHFSRAHRAHLVGVYTRLALAGLRSSQRRAGPLH